MLVCIAGKNNIAVAGLEEIYRLKNIYGDFEIGVICNKNEAGTDTWQKSLRHAAQKLDIKEYTLEDIYSKKDLLFISLEFDQIIKPNKFASSKLFNIHFSLLPKYKGMYTSALPILNGETLTGVTLHKIDSGIDTGDIIDQLKIEINKKDTARDLYVKYNIYGIKLLRTYLFKLIYDIESINMQRQDASHSTYYSKNSIDYANLSINLFQTAKCIQNQIRAFSFREYQMPVVYNEIIIGSYITSIKSQSKSGTILHKNENSMMIATIDYNLVLYFDKYNQLFEACKVGNLDMVKEICIVKDHINVQNEYGRTPIMTAAFYGHKEIIYYLISIGANLELKDNDGNTINYYINKLNVKNKWLEDI